MRAKHLSRGLCLTEEQEAIRLRGVRILARMIAQAHLRSLFDRDAAGKGSAPAPALQGDDSRREVGRAG